MSSGVIGDRQLIVNVVDKRASTELSLRAKRGNLMGLLRHFVPRNDNLSMAFTIIPTLQCIIKLYVYIDA
jgi:hypothetical protein